MSERRCDAANRAVAGWQKRGFQASRASAVWFCSTMSMSSSACARRHSSASLRSWNCRRANSSADQAKMSSNGARALCDPGRRQQRSDAQPLGAADRDLGGDPAAEAVPDQVNIAQVERLQHVEIEERHVADAHHPFGDRRAPEARMLRRDHAAFGREPRRAADPTTRRRRRAGTERSGPRQPRQQRSLVPATSIVDSFMDLPTRTIKPHLRIGANPYSRRHRRHIGYAGRGKCRPAVCRELPSRCGRR